jgi:hypothetical protein
MQLEGLGKLEKNPITLSGIKPMTFWPVAYYNKTVLTLKITLIRKPQMRVKNHPT